LTARPTRLLLVSVLAFSVALVGCGEPEQEANAPVSQEVELEAYDFYFEETSFMFDLGANVTFDFVNAGEATHSFTVDDLDIDIEAASGETTEITIDLPDEPGIFDFFCKYHPEEMSGTVSIGGAGDPIDEDDFPEDDDDADVDVDVEEENDPGAGGGAGYDY
jgi:plastocyanin